MSAVFSTCFLLFYPPWDHRPYDDAVILSGSSLLSETFLEMSSQMCLEECLLCDFHDSQVDVKDYLSHHMKTSSVEK